MFMMAPKMATPKELPIDRKKTLDEVAVPRSSSAAAFWMATISTGMIRPTPRRAGTCTGRPSRPACARSSWTAGTCRCGINTDPMMGQALYRPVRAISRPVTMDETVMPAIIGRSSKPDRSARAR